jgi:hypothetical protein
MDAMLILRPEPLRQNGLGSPIPGKQPPRFFAEFLDEFFQPRPGKLRDPP